MTGDGGAPVAVADAAPPARGARGGGVASQTALILGARVVGAISTAVITIVLTRLLGVAGYGDYALALTIATIAGLFASLGVDSATSRWVAEGYNRGEAVWIAVRVGLRLRALLAGVTFGLLFLLAGPIAHLFGHPGLANAVRAATVALCFSAGFSWVSGVFEGLRSGVMLAVVSLVKAVVEFVVVVGLLVAGFGAVGALLGNAASYAVAVGVGMYAMRSHLVRSEAPSATVSGQELLKYGIHIWLAGVAWLLFERVDLVLLGAFLDTTAVGLYDAPWRIATILGLLGLSLASAVTPRLASQDAMSAGRLLTKALRVGLVFYILLSVIIAVAARDIIVLLLGEDYARSADVLRILLPYIILIGFAPIVSRALDYLGGAAVRKWIALAAFVVNLALDLVLIPTVGLLGPAIATGVAILVFVAGHLMLVVRQAHLDNRRLLATIARSLGSAAAGGAFYWALIVLDVPPVVRLLAGFPLAVGVAVVMLIGVGEVRDESGIPPSIAVRLRAIDDWFARHLDGITPRDLALLVPILAAALVMGLAVGRNPLIAVGGLVAIAVVTLLLSDLTIGVVAFVLIQPLALVIPAGEAVVAKGAGVILMVTWAVALRYRSSRGKYLGFVASNAPVVFLIVAFMGWLVASLLWSINTAASIDAIQRYALGFVLLGIVFTATFDRGAAIRVAGAFSLSGGLSTLLGLAMNRRGDEGRFIGTFLDANEYAAFCVPSLLIAVALAASASTPLRRIAFLSTALLCGAGIVLSGSRGGIIAIGAALAVWIVFGGRWRVRVLVASIAVVFVLVGYIETAASPALRTRIETVYKGQQFGTSAGTGRADIWQVGLRVYRAHPAVGTGTGTFTDATPRYLAQAGLVRRLDFFTETPKVAHNMYLHLLVEVGIVGLALFGGLLLACVAAAIRAAWLFRRTGDVTMELLSRTVAAGSVGLLVADFFISAQYQRVLWILMGICLALYGVARRQASVRAPEPGGPAWAPDARRTARTP
ncbi:MAG: oligosaccharide flippase family protein [Thermoleophilia bacterium]|nr:oligosaccharide flippase family protein [Thermoleophilia bacterium]